MKRAVIFFGILFFMGLVPGCGYTTRVFVAQTGYKTIYVAPFVNKVDTTSEFSQGSKFKTYYPLLESKITNAVIDKYIFDGNLKVVQEPDADIILTGDLVNYRRDSLRDSSAEVPEEYRTTLFVNIKLVNTTTKKVIWEKNEFAGDSSYFTTGNFVKSESQALDDATKDLARRIVELTVEAW